MEKLIKPAKTLGCSGVADGNPPWWREVLERGMKGEIDTLYPRSARWPGNSKPAIWPAFLGRLEALRASSWARLAQLGEERAALGV